MRKLNIFVGDLLFTIHFFLTKKKFGNKMQKLSRVSGLLDINMADR